MAARGGHTHVVKLLLESGAYVDDYDHLAVAAEAVSNGNNNNSCRFGQFLRQASSLLKLSLHFLCITSLFYDCF